MQFLRVRHLEIPFRLDRSAHAFGLGAFTAALLMGGASARSQDCGMGWETAGAGLNGAVRALVTHDDGGGPALFAGGLFNASTYNPLGNVARWNGVEWSALAAGVNGEVLALVSAPSDGSSVLVAAGAFTGASDGAPGTAHIAQWNGLVWSAIGGGMDGPVRALAVFNDGSGAAIYAGGYFTKAGGVDARRIAKWNGVTWTSLGTGLNGGALALAAHDDGHGPALFVGGAFNDAGGVTAHGIAKWDGAQWSALTPAGIIGGPGIVRSLAVYSGAGGPRLYAAGAFTSAGGVPVSNIARWNGFSWAGAGAGIVGEQVNALSVFDDGDGPALYAAGHFAVAGGAPAPNIARWNGATWAALGMGVDDEASALAVFDESSAGRAPALFVGGSFLNAGGAPASRIARWGAFGCVGPIITRQPQDTTTHPDGRAEFEVEVAGSEPITFQWRREGVPIFDGANIQGATSSKLVIQPASILDVGSYDVLVTGPGGDLPSDSVFLSVVPACPGDASGDGRVNFIDITAVMVDWGSIYLPEHGTGSGDANGDGVVDFHDFCTILAFWGQDCVSHRE